MKSNHLNTAIINEVFSRLNDGELTFCQAMGFTRSELSAISQLSTTEVLALCNSRASFAELKVNHDVFWHMYHAVKEKTHELEIIDRALTLGISGEMLNERFGWTSGAISARRKLLKINESIGRKPNATPETELAIWTQWQELKPQNLSIMFDKHQGLDILMLIAEEVGVSVTEVWRLVQGWINEERGEK